MKNIKLFVAVLGLTGLLCHLSARSAVEKHERAKTSLDHGIDLSGMNPRCSPSADFYEYANGTWLARHPIPADYASWGRWSLTEVRNMERLRQIMQAAAADKNKGEDSSERKIGNFYLSGMNEAALETQGTKPLSAELAAIDAIGDRQALQDEVLKLQSLGADVLFSFGSSQDFKDSTRFIADARQGGLGLPDRDYYTDADASAKKLRDEYLAHVRLMFLNLGDSEAKADAEAKAVMDIEGKLALASMKNTETRNPDNIYHKMSKSQLCALTPDFSWQSYFAGLGHGDIAEINVEQPDFFKEVNRQLMTTGLSDWRAYLRFHLIDAAAPSLSRKFVDEDFDFKGRILSGKKELLPRWKRVVTAVNGAMGEAVGKRYVELYFPPSARVRVAEMVQNFKATLKGDLSALSWMEQSTREKAIAKLEAFVAKVGYPDKWRDYSALKIEPGCFVENVFRANRFEFQRQLSKIGKPVDRLEWLMSPQTINAYYDAQMNEIVFPAGILQPPLFDPDADDATNYGAIGMVIGHEMTHGFDDQGSKFDAAGNLNNWWSANDLKSFQARVACIEKQYDGYTTSSGMHLKGKLVAGESAADLGGLTIAYKALKKSLENKPHANAPDGFTPEQRFFLSFAQSWAVNYRPEKERLMATTDPHPPARYRVNGTVSNMPAFAEAFDCKSGEPMARPSGERCIVW